LRMGAVSNSREEKASEGATVYRTPVYEHCYEMVMVRVR
jgi:hypothetical protein